MSIEEASKSSTTNTQAAVIMQPANIQPPTPLSLEGNIAENWKHFLQVWKNYSIITSIDKQPETYRVALFLHCIGQDALKIYNGFSFQDADDRTKLDKIIEQFQQYAIGQVNETFERFKFNSRDQGEAESIDAYVTELKNMAKTCNFDALHDSLIRDRIVFGIWCKKTRQKLLQERQLTLAKCIDICRSSETANTQMKAIASGHSEEVNRVQSAKQNNKPTYERKQKNNWNSRPKPSRRACIYCGKQHERSRESCPAWGKQCKNCGIKNHFASVCRQKQSAHSVQDQT